MGDAPYLLGREKGDILCDILKRFFQEAEESGPEEGIRERVEGLVETILKKDAGAMQAWLEESVRR